MPAVEFGKHLNLLDYGEAGMNRMKLLAILSFTLAGCASNAPVNTKTSALQLDYHTQVNAPQNGKIIAITSFEIITNNASQTERSDVNTFSIKLASRSLPFSAVTSYHENYEAPLRTAMQSTLAEMISKRGFTATGPFKSANEIPYVDKKNLYLIIVPKLNLNIGQRSSSHSCMHSVCTDTGVITLDGDLLIRFVEPLTDQTLLTKHIELTGSGISKNYVHQYPQETHKAVMQGLMYNDISSNSLIDDADKVLADAITDYYQQSMVKIDNLISAEELLSYQHDLDQIRGFKRN